MMNLLRAELGRLRSRRLSWVAVAGILIAIGLLQIAVYQTVKPLSAAELEEGRQQYQQAVQDYEQNKAQYEEGAKECVAQGNSAEDCDPRPKPEQYTYRTPEPFADITNIAVTVTVFLSTLAILFVAASFIGAEYSSGALANWLSFIPERGKVFASKLLAIVIAAAVVSFLASALTIGVAAIISSSVGADVAGAGKLFEMAGRGVVIGVIGAVIGFVLAMLTRHTIAAAGTVLGYLLVSFVLSILSQAIMSLQAIKPWLAENNILAFLNHGYKYVTYVNRLTDDGMDMQEVEHTITFAHSTVYWSVIVAVAIAVTFSVFRRRDVN
ncbi:MAG: ABC transporter permease subunit [Propionibacteriaceae bacterium]